LQFFRLVGPHVDKVIAFDELPARLLEGIRHRECTGLPRHWLEQACNKKEVEFIRQAPLKNEKKTVYFHYMLEYVMVNADKEKWQEITNFVRKVVDTKVRLMDKMEDMALPMAPNFKDALTLEPEDIMARAVLPIPIEAQELVSSIAESSPSSAIVISNESGTVTEVVGKASHTCESGGRGGRYAPAGKCLRCDQLRSSKKELVAA